MSGYLHRLVMRSSPMAGKQAAAAGATRPMKPFVRSLSPVAELDQRVGMAGFAEEDLGGGASLPGRSLSEEQGLGTDAGQERSLAPAAPTDMAASDESGAAGLQSGTTAGVTAQIRAGLSPASRSVKRADTAPSVPSEPANDQGEALQPSVTHTGVPETDSFSRAVKSPSTPPGRDFAREFAVPDSSIRNSGGEAPRHEDSRTGNGQLHVASRQVGAIAAGRRLPGQARRDDSPRLEPRARVYAEGQVPSPAADRPSATEAQETPRVFVGRIDVEVTPPPAPRPMTAASASVIGPLRSGVRPGLRFTLRHR